MGKGKSDFNRVLLKVSGEALMADREFGLDQGMVERVSHEIKSVNDFGVQVCLVVGGGNIFRGVSGAAGGMERASADYMGMLGTVINALALKEAIEKQGQPARVMSALEIESVSEPFIRARALRHFEKGRVLILAAGTGNPFFTTDTCASLRAIELEADILLKATKVDGVYDCDPRQNELAKKYDTLTFTDAITKQLGVMDLTALSMCMEHNLPIVVFNFKEDGNICKAVGGHTIGTLVNN